MLPSRRDRVVAAEYPRQVPCKLAFVGEAPSDEEVEKLRPFVGESGRVLNAMLASANIDRGECFVGNVFEKQLEDNDIAAERERQGAAWDDYYRASVGRLWNDLQTCRPRVVVPLGNTALAAFTNGASIAKVRGTVLYGSGQYTEQKLVPTLHPAAILRQWNLYAICIGDIIRAAAEAEKGYKIEWPHRLINVAPSISEVEEYLKGPCRECDLLSVDIETGWGQVRGISFAPSANEAIYVPFISLGTLSRSYWFSAAEEKRAWVACKGVLESDVPKLGQNFSGYDIQWLYKKMGIRVRNLRHDTRLLHAALYPELPKSLAFMGAAYSSQGAWKGWVSHSGTRSKDREGKRDE